MAASSQGEVSIGSSSTNVSKFRGKEDDLKSRRASIALTSRVDRDLLSKAPSGVKAVKSCASKTESKKSVGASTTNRHLHSSSSSEVKAKKPRDKQEEKKSRKESLESSSSTDLPDCKSSGVKVKKEKSREKKEERKSRKESSSGDERKRSSKSDKPKKSKKKSSFTNKQAPRTGTRSRQVLAVDEKGNLVYVDPPEEDEDDVCVSFSSSDWPVNL